ncbi:hypothetical protein LTR15_010396 [Elasticomyces elasticus]|nr:hypothetical protein LTR15_010396 [Elasticomyces elasticus]
MSNIRQIGELTPNRELFATPEILEAILLHLPLIDLLFSQKVCRTWKAVVDTSPSIKKALFLVPDTKPDLAIPTTDAMLSAVAINSLLLTYIRPGPSSFRTIEHYVGYYAIQSGAVQSDLEASCCKMYLSRPPIDTDFYFRAEVKTFTNSTKLAAPEQHELSLNSEKRFGDLMQLYYARLDRLGQRKYEAASELKIQGDSLRRSLPYDMRDIETAVRNCWSRRSRA